MSEKKFTVQPNDEIIIRIPKRIVNSAESNRVPKPAAKKAMLPARRFDDSGARRLKKGEFINFYDVNLVKNESGDYLDETFKIAKAPVNGDSDIPTPTKEDFEVYQNLLLATPISNWKNKFKRIDKTNAGKYDLALQINGGSEIDFSDANADWTDKGLKAENITQLFFQNFGAFHYFDTAADTIKITTQPDFDAEDSALQIGKFADIFLLPPIVRFFMFGTPDGTTNRQYVLDDLWTAFRRSHFLETGFFDRDSPLASPPDFVASALVNEFIAYLKTLPGARNNSYDAAAIWQNEPLDNFPLSVEGVSERHLGAALGYAPVGEILIAVIKAGQTFYVWLKEPSAALKYQIFRY